MITLQEVTEALPTHLKSAASQGMVDTLNQISADPLAARTIRDNFISYSSVLKEGRFKMGDYINAVAYASYKVMGYSNKEAYSRTFPQRYQGLIARGATDKDISAYVSAYNKNKLVTLVMEQTVIPIWILNQDAVQKAINTQLDLMENASSEKVRAEAANSILTHLKRPETKNVSLEVDIADKSGLDELRDAMKELRAAQKASIESGMSTKDIAHQTIINGTAKDITPDE